MKQILFFVFSLCLTIVACSSGKTTKSQQIKQGLEGRLLLETGNRMPMKGAPPYQPKGIRDSVFVYEPTNTSQVARVGTSPIYTAIYTKRVASLMTDSTGGFRVALPAGSYSLFVKQGNHYFANQFDTANNIALITVERRKLTRVNITVNSGATY